MSVDQRSAIKPMALQQFHPTGPFTSPHDAAMQHSSRDCLTAKIENKK
jgi:hypothetical protein